MHAQVQQPLFTAPQWLMPGQYQFPFSFILPHHVPGSIVYKESDGRSSNM